MMGRMVIIMWGKWKESWCPPKNSLHILGACFWLSMSCNTFAVYGGTISYPCLLVWFGLGTKPRPGGLSLWISTF